MGFLTFGITLVASFLGSLPSVAAEAAPQPYAEAIVLGGGRTEDDAKRAIREFQNADGAKVSPADGFPKILSSDDFPGAPPHTYIAVLGYCDPKGASGQVKKILKVITTGAYSMPMAGEFEGACPTISPELLKNEKAPAPKKSR